MASAAGYGAQLLSVAASNATGGDLTTSEADTLAVITRVVSSFSLIGSILIMASFLKFKRLQTFAFRLVFYLSMCEFLFSVTNLMGLPDEDSGWCFFQAFGNSFFTVAAVLWTTVIAYCLNQSFGSSSSASLAAIPQNKLMGRFHLYCWGIPFVLSLLPLFTDSYGHAGAACWIKPDGVGYFWRFFQFYVPLVSVF